MKLRNKLEEVKKFDFKTSKEDLKQTKPKIYLFSGDFKSKIDINIERNDNEKELNSEQNDDK